MHRLVVRKACKYETNSLPFSKRTQPRSLGACLAYLICMDPSFRGPLDVNKFLDTFSVHMTKKKTKDNSIDGV